jgi:AcrR family transcriptional regulator
MLQNQARVARSRGRPQLRSDEETLRLVVEAAAGQFQTRGYAGTAMGEVAQLAGISTKTLYRLVPAKDVLFNMVVEERIGRFMLDIDEAALAGLDLAAALARILTAYGALTLAADTVALNRLVLGESDRFPELGTSFYQRAIRPTHAAMSGWLRRQAEAGLIRLDDPDLATGMLRGMMIQEPQRATMLGQRAAPDAAEIAARAGACAKLFLDGCRA